MAISSREWTPTRAEGLRRLEAFVPRAGRDYARRRNHDHGPGRHTDVSGLSPWLRHRLLLEEEVLAPVIATHGFEAAGKFIQEVFWRTYWKGWLEMRPSVWADYRQQVRALQSEFGSRLALRNAWEAATTGRTGIDCFDAWADELVETGYLHNHARMWFASIWIFTLRLPWELGADFFLRHLLDGDPASNTLSWRWVAGLQTRGKHYLARPENIAKYTNGRFTGSGQLAGSAAALPGEPPPPPIEPPTPVRWDREMPTGLLLTEDDLHPDFVLDGNPGIRHVGALGTTAQRSPLGVSPTVQAFADGAIDSALARVADREARRLESVADVVGWARSARLRQVVAPYTPVGPAAEMIAAVATGLAPHGIGLIPTLRRWDHIAWPHATRGFFALRKKIPLIWAAARCADDEPPSSRAPGSARASANRA